MTLILNCITRDFVFQVSDRRLTNIVTQTVADVDNNKAIDYWGSLAFGFTGLAYIGKEQTDIWLGKTLRGYSPPLEILESVRKKISNHFKTLPYLIRHAFVGIGWMSPESDRPMRPVVILVSNFHSEKLTELTSPKKEFDLRFIPLAENLSQDFFVVFSVGAHLSTDIATNLKRYLHNCVKRPKSVGPKTFVRLLALAAREVADKNPTVGKDLLAISIPKKSLDSRFSQGPKGNICLTSELNIPNRETRAFSYIPENSLQSIAYGPIMVFGDSLTEGFTAKEAANHGLIAMTRPILEDNAIGGLQLKAGGVHGQFIGIPPKNFYT